MLTSSNLENSEEKVITDTNIKNLTINENEISDLDDYILSIKISDILKDYNIKLIKDTYKKYGIIIFKNLLKEDADFIEYKNNLIFMCKNELIKYIDYDKLPDSLEELIYLINKYNKSFGKIISNMGTQPNKFISFNKIKYSKWLTYLLTKVLFNEEGIICTPQAGDTLHVFLPKGDTKYALPEHQDYQYLMQSPDQITCYMGITDYNKDVGGLEFWINSNDKGIRKCHKNINDSWQITDIDDLKNYNKKSYYWNSGDFGIFDSLIVHKSIPCTSETMPRLVQIFRYSNINNSISKEYNYLSSTYLRDGIKFNDFHKDLFEK